MTSGPSQIEVVTLAIYLLGGDQKTIDTEDAAVKAHELAPSRFSWRKYPQQVNLELVRVYLSAAKNPIRAGYLEGSGKTGWSLTPKGKSWADRIGRHFMGANLNRPREAAGGGPPDEQKWRRERDRILKSVAWERWLVRDLPISRKEAEAVFRIDSYAVGRMRTLKIERLTSLFETDQSISAFLAEMRQLVHDNSENA